MGLFLGSQFYAIDLYVYVTPLPLNLTINFGANFLLFQDCFSDSGSLAFLYGFQDELVSFCQKASGIFIGTALNLKINVGD